VRVLAGVGHFFHGRLSELRETEREFAAPLLRDPTPSRPRGG
jgi:hypothetical protein